MIKCLQVAKDEGVVKGQAQHFLSIGYIPLPWQWKFHALAREADKINGPVDIGAGGARGPGKSHVVLAQAALDDCQRIPRLKGLFLRQTGISAQESFDDLVLKVIHGKISYRKTGSILRFSNRSRIVLGGFQDENDIDKYIGIEYDFIIVEELNQLTEEKYIKLRGSLRTSKSNWRPRMYTSFNPGGIGHEFVKQRYIIPYRENKEKETRFVPSDYRSNPYLNKEYIEYLLSLKGDLGRAWREGDWDVFAGQVFTEFRYESHSIKEIMPLRSVPHYISFDWGYSAPFSCHASALIRMKSEDGQVFNRVVTYQEWYGTEKTPREWATKIYKESYMHKFEDGYCDPAMFNRQTDGSIPIAKEIENTWEELHKSGWLLLKPGTKNRISRWATMHNWLSIAPDGLPYWVITRNCINLIRTIPLMIYDEHKKDDIDSEAEDHAVDETSYFLTQVKFIEALGSIKRGQGIRAKTIERIQRFKPMRATIITEEQTDDMLNAFENVKIQNRDWRAV